MSLNTSPMHDRPLAATGLTSYRLKGPYGWIMIGARDHEDAMTQAARSTEAPAREALQVWDGLTYIDVEWNDLDADQARYDYDRQCHYDRLHQMKRLRDLNRLPRPIDAVDQICLDACRRILNGAAVLPRCVDLADSAYLAELDQFAAEETARGAKGYYVPDWAKYTQIGQVASVADAMDRYYKSERLNRPGGTRERLIASNQEEYEAKGFACIASYHDSVNGHSIYVRRAEHGIDIYSSNHA